MILENNWDDFVETRNPLFINEGPYSNPSMDDPYFEASNPLSKTVPDLRLQESSPCIDAGGALTTAVGAGSASSNLVVVDSLYFQDGNFGQGRTAWHDYVNLQPDWIAIGTVSNAVAISSINYETHTIKLAEPKTWSDKAPVWLYKISDGTRVLYGTAPDTGAHEFEGEGAVDGPTAPPRNFRLLD